MCIIYFKLNGLACTKAGGTPLQGDRGGFDSLRVHKTIGRTHKTNWGFLAGSKLLETFAIWNGWSILNAKLMTYRCKRP